MRCSCRYCDSGAYMIQAESSRLGCVCPVCGAHCADCLGTNTVVNREAFQAMKRAAAREREAQPGQPPSPHGVPGP